MNVQALLHDSPSEQQHRRQRHDNNDNNSHWPQIQSQRPTSSPPRYSQDPPPLYHHSPSSHPPQSQSRRQPPPPQSAHTPSSAHPSPAMASLRPLDSPRTGAGPTVTLANPPPAGPVATTGAGLHMSAPTPLTSSVTGPGVWGPDKPLGSDFQKETDMRDWDRDVRDRPRDLPRERLALHPPPPPPFGDPPRRKNVVMEVNGPLAGPGVPLGPGIPGSDDLASRSHPSSRRPSISNPAPDIGKNVVSPTEDEMRGREQPQRFQEIQLKERPVREPSRERDRDNWVSDNAYQRSRDRRYIKAYNPHLPEQTREYRHMKPGLDGPGMSPLGDYRDSYRMQTAGQPPPMRDGGRETPKAELVVLKRNDASAGDRDRDRERERESGPGPERERDRERMDRERAVLHPSYGVIPDRDRDRHWGERERDHHMGYPDRDRERGPPPPSMGNISSHHTLPPPAGHSGHSHSHPHSHTHTHHHHREQGHSHSLHPATLHHSPPGGPPPPPPVKGSPHPHGHSSSRHPPQVIHHPQPQPPAQIQLLPHPQQPHIHMPHPHAHSHSQSHPHGHPSQAPPSHPPSSQPHSPHSSHVHGPPPPHHGYRSHPPSQPSGSGMSPHQHQHHHHHHHHPTPPSQSSSHPSRHHPPPPQSQFQSQFHTQFISGLPQPGSRIGSPASGPVLHQQPPPPPQQHRAQMQSQSRGISPGASGPPPVAQQQQQQQQQQQISLSVSGSKGVGLGLSGVPGLEPPDAGNNVPGTKRGSPRPRKARAGDQSVDVERDRGVPPDKAGRTAFMDVDGIEGIEGVEDDVGQAVLTETEEPEEEREFKAKVKINLGTFIYPRLPFPYFFDLGRGVLAQVENSEAAAGKEVKGEDSTKVDEVPETKQDEDMKNSNDSDKADDQVNGPDADKREMTEADVKKTEDVAIEKDKDLLDLETRVTIIIPNGHIPGEKPLRPKIWGGGLSDRSQAASDRSNPKGDARINGLRGRSKESPAIGSDGKQVTVTQKRRRRMYTDDSDLFLCALHSGWVTWSGAACARSHGKDIKMELRVIRCLSAPGGARLVEGVSGKEEIVGQFLGGRGERCFNDACKVKRQGRRPAEDDEKGKQKEKTGGEGRSEKNEKNDDEDPELEEGVEVETSDSDDDGRGLTSAAWGSGHDGSAIEVLGVEFVERGTARSSSGLGLRNRTQRMWEYNERRMAVLGLAAASNVRGPMMRLAGRKRRRGCDWPSSYPRRLPNAAILDVIPEVEEEEDRGLAVDDDYPEERSQMDIRTVVFGTHTGFKYVPSVLQDLLFSDSSIPDCPRPKKRRKVDDCADVEMVDAESCIQSPQQKPRPIMLLTKSEQYILSPCTPEQTGERKYDVSLVLGVDATVAAEPPCGNTSSEAIQGSTENNAESPQPPTSPNTDKKTNLKPLKSGVGRSSFQLLNEEIVIDEDLRIPILSWRWGQC